jgi:hypothetical protein
MMSLPHERMMFKHYHGRDIRSIDASKRDPKKEEVRYGVRSFGGGSTEKTIRRNSGTQTTLRVMLLPNSVWAAVTAFIGGSAKHSAF